MGERSRLNIGIIFNHGKEWLGGAYYLLNIIESLEFLPDSQKPFLTIFYRPNSLEFAEQVNYPYKKLVELEPVSKYMGYVNSLLKAKNVYAEQFINYKLLDGLFPFNDFPKRIKSETQKTVAWIPDLQHKFYPLYFSLSNRFLREERIKLILKNSTDMVVSSEDVKNNFHQFYDIPAELKIHTVPFVSLIQSVELDDINTVKNKYNIREKYFIVSNQFYEHKNHLLILEALKIIRNRGEKVNFIFTGKINDDRYTTYLKRLKKDLEEDEIKSSIKLLGLIPRKEQLTLLKHAEAIVQPSLFEGWSTIVEDAKSLQAQLIVSDLDVHKEQLGEKGFFFEKDSALSLADILLEKWNNPDKKHEIFTNYQERVQSFAESFINIFT